MAKQSDGKACHQPHLVLLSIYFIGTSSKPFPVDDMLTLSYNISRDHKTALVFHYIQITVFVHWRNLISSKILMLMYNLASFHCCLLNRIVFNQLLNGVNLPLCMKQCSSLLKRKFKRRLKLNISLQYKTLLADFQFSPVDVGNALIKTAQLN